MYDKKTFDMYDKITVFLHDKKTDQVSSDYFGNSNFLYFDLIMGEAVKSGNRVFVDFDTFRHRLLQVEEKDIVTMTEMEDAWRQLVLDGGLIDMVDEDEYVECHRIIVNSHINPFKKHFYFELNPDCSHLYGKLAAELEYQLSNL